MQRLGRDSKVLYVRSLAVFKRLMGLELRERRHFKKRYKRAANGLVGSLTMQCDAVR